MDCPSSISRGMSATLNAAHHYKIIGSIKQSSDSIRACISDPGPRNSYPLNLWVKQRIDHSPLSSPLPLQAWRQAQGDEAYEVHKLCEGC